MPQTGDGATFPDTLWAEVNATASGDNTVITGVSGRRIRVTAITFTCSAAAQIAFKSGASTTRINPMSFAANGGMDTQRLPPNYFLETNTGDAFVMNLDGTYNVRGSCNYVLVS